MSTPTLLTLKRRADFLTIAASKRKAVRPTLIVQAGTLPAHMLGVSPLPYPPLLIYGLTASRKVGNAVVRNRAKRRLRGLVRTVMLHHAKTEYAYVLIARIGASTCRWDALRHDLERALRALNAWESAAEDCERGARKWWRQLASPTGFEPVLPP